MGTLETIVMKYTGVALIDYQTALLTSVNVLLSYSSYLSYLILFLPNSCHLDPSKTLKVGPRLYNANSLS